MPDFICNLLVTANEERGDNMKINVPFVKKLMEERNLSGSDLARMMGVSRMEVSRILNGSRDGGKKTIGGLMKAFPEIPVTELFILC